MHITQWGEYGIQCSAFIAKRERAGALVVSAHEIADAQKIDLQYAQQILHRLKRNDVIKSVRGPHGGYGLNARPDQITLHDILLACEGNTFDIICEVKPINADRCDQSSPCNLRPIWYKLKTHINEFLTGYTLADLLDAKEPEDIIVQLSGTKAS